MAQRAVARRAAGTSGPRSYRSTRRAEQAAQTRAAVLAAARELFGDNGWAATGVRDVARAAGVAVETVYANFGSKVDLLQAALDAAIVDDTEPVALSDRPEFAALGQGSAVERARAAALLVREINERTHGIGRALREAAAGDPELAKRLTEGERRRRVDVERGARLVAGRTVTQTERDGLWAVLSMEVYGLLVNQAGWKAKRYEDWVAGTIVRLLQPVEEEQA